MNGRTPKRTLVMGSAAITLIAAVWLGAHQADLTSTLATHAGLNSAPAGHSGSASATQTGGLLVLEPSQLQRQIAGKPVAYLFTASGCTSCFGEVQAMQAAVKAMQAAARGNGAIQFVGVDMASSDSPADLTGWLQASGADSTMFVWTIDKDGGLTRKFSVTSLGTSVLVDSSGRLRFVNQTSTDASLLANQLAQLT